MEEQAGKRQLKVAGQIKKDIAEILRLKGMSFFGGALVSVSGVQISPDLASAKIFVSVFPSDKAAPVMKTLGDNTSTIRGELGGRVGRQLRIVPGITFCVENSLDYVEHIEELLKK